MTDISSPFSVGDFIIDYENIYQISSQKDQTDYSGKTRSYFFYKPIGLNHQKEATYSTPIGNIAISGFRALISADIVKKLYQEAGSKIDHEAILDFKSIKETSYQNDPQKSLVILKQLFLEKSKAPSSFSKTSQEILEPILKHLCDEIAFVTNTPFEKVKQKIVSLIQKSIK